MQYLVFHNIFDVKVWWGHKIVRRLVLWNQQFLRYAYKFWKEYKTTNVHMYWKLNLNTLHHFIMKYKLHGMVTRHSRRWIPWCSTTSVFSSLEVKYQLLPSFYMNIKFDELFSEIDNVLQRKRVSVKVNHISRIRLKEFSFSTFKLRHVTP